MLTMISFFGKYFLAMPTDYRAKSVMLSQY